jgi:hypothetical protein
MLHIPNFMDPNVKPNLTADSTPTVTGYALALGKASASERAFTAANLALGRLALIEPRVAQAARLARVCEPYVEAAIEVLRSNDPELETLVRDGKISLFEAAVLAKHPRPSLTEKFMAASAAERADLAKTAGPAVLWDELIAPNV